MNISTSSNISLAHLLQGLLVALVVTASTAGGAQAQDWSNYEDPTDREYSWSALMGGGFTECFNFRIWELPLSEDCFGDATQEDTNREQAEGLESSLKSMLGKVGGILVDIKHAVSQFQDLKSLYKQFKDLFEDFDLESAERTVYSLSQSADRLETRMDQNDRIHSAIPNVVPGNRYDKIAVFVDRAFAALNDAEDFGDTYAGDLAENYRNLGIGDVSISRTETDSAADSTSNGSNLPPLGTAGPPASLNVYNHSDDLIYPEAAAQTAAASADEEIEPTERPVSYYQRHITQTKGNEMTAEAVAANIQRWNQIISTIRQREAVYEREKAWTGLYMSFEHF